MAARSRLENLTCMVDEVGSEYFLLYYVFVCWFDDLMSSSGLFQRDLLVLYIHDPQLSTLPSPVLLPNAATPILPTTPLSTLPHGKHHAILLCCCAVRVEFSASMSPSTSLRNVGVTGS